MTPPDPLDPFIRRKGQQTDPSVAPAYMLVQELEHFYIVEYCGTWKLLDKCEYEMCRKEHP